MRADSATWDFQHSVGYIHLEEPRDEPGRSVRQREVPATVIYDFDEEGSVIGVEILAESHVSAGVVTVRPADGGEQ